MYKKYQKEYCALYRIDPLIIRYSSISHRVFLILKNLLWENFSYIEVEPHYSGLYTIWLELYANQNSLSYDLSNMGCTSALTMKEKNTFLSQNGVTVVQAFKMELGSHCGCGFRHVPESKNLNFICLFVLTVRDSKTLPAVLKTASASSNPCLTNPFISCQIQS